ncbi:Gp15 family bacteriophage protein [Eggerthellaceae bacterium 24-137]
MATLRSDIGYLDGCRFRVIEHEGQPVRVYDDADTALRLIALFKDRELPPEVKSRCAMQLLFPDPGAVANHEWEDFWSLFSRLLWEIAGIDSDGSHPGEGGPRWVDWEADADYIEASLWRTYGQPSAAMARQLSLREYARMVSLCPHDTPMGQAIYYRTADEPRAGKYNQDEVARFRRAKRAWALEARAPEDEYRSASVAATDAFRGIAAAAGRGK